MQTLCKLHRDAFVSEKDGSWEIAKLWLKKVTFSAKIAFFCFTSLFSTTKWVFSSRCTKTSFSVILCVFDLLKILFFYRLKLSQSINYIFDNSILYVWHIKVSTLISDEVFAPEKNNKKYPYFFIKLFYLQFAIEDNS